MILLISSIKSYDIYYRGFLLFYFRSLVVVEINQYVIDLEILGIGEIPLVEVMNEPSWIFGFGSLELDLSMWPLHKADYAPGWSRRAQ